ncbi:hypothetical protein ACA910_014558 [Epithemia clementina (nom. ined.)]
MTTPNNVSEEDVIKLVGERIDKIKSLGQRISEHPIYLFTHSIPGVDNEINEFPAQLACSVPNGVWSKIEDESRIVDSLSSYYKLFALGLSADVNSHFVAWVEPYLFASIDVYGTTVSVPVYDRTKEPNLFLGVVGVDFVMPALDEALGVTNESSKESISRVVKHSAARCPRLELGECVMESYRRQSSAEDPLAFCPGSSNNCSDTEFVQIEEQKCSGASDYPISLWDNVEKRDLSLLEAVCCHVGADILERSCPAPPDKSDANLGLIVGISACGACVMVAVALFLYFRCSKRVSRTITEQQERYPRRWSPPPSPINPNFDHLRFEPSAPSALEVTSQNDNGESEHNDDFENGTSSIMSKDIPSESSQIDENLGNPQENRQSDDLEYHRAVNY